MAIGSFRQVFVQAGNSCALCYLSSEPHEKEKREENYAFANNCLSQIIKKTEEKSEDQKMAKQAQESRRGCNYSGPKIKDDLESMGIKFS